MRNVFRRLQRLRKPAPKKSAAARPEPVNKQVTSTACVRRDGNGRCGRTSTRHGIGGNSSWLDGGRQNYVPI